MSFTRSPFLLLAGILSLASPLTLAQQADTSAQSLEALLQAAWRTHPTVLAKRSGSDAAQADLEGAKWQRYPTPSLESSRRSGGTTTTVLRVDQALFAGGRISGNIDVAGKRLEAADAGVSEARIDVGLRVIAAWAVVRRQQMRQEYAIAAVKEHEKLVQLITRRVEREVSPKVDKDFAQSRLLQSLNDLSSVNQSLNTALLQLGQLTGKPVSAIGPEPKGEAPRTREDALAQAENSSPLLKRLLAEEEAALADIDVKRSVLWPQVTLRLEKQTGDLPDNRAMVVLTAQPGAGLSAGAGVDAALSRREAARQARDAALRDVQEQIGTDWNSYTAARLRLENAKQAKAMSAEVFESYARQYTTGRKTWIDVLNAVRETTQADYAQADANAEATSAALRLRLRSGQLLPALYQDGEGKPQS